MKSDDWNSKYTKIHFSDEIKIHDLKNSKKKDKTMDGVVFTKTRHITVNGEKKRLAPVDIDSLNNYRKLSDIEKNLMDNLTIPFEDFYYCFKGLEQIKYIDSTGKLFMYAISKLNTDTCISKIYTKQYITLRGFSHCKNGIRQVIADVDSLRRLDGVLYNKKNHWFYSNIIYNIDFKKHYIHIEFNKYFVDHLKNLYFWLPTSLFATKEKQAPHSWSIGYEIFRYIRCSRHGKKTTFSRTIKSIIENSNLRYDIETKQVKRKLYTPLKKSIDYLNSIQDSIVIELPPYNINILEESIKIKVKDLRLLETYQREIIVPKSTNTLLRPMRIREAKKLKKEGYTIEQIAKQLKVSVRTINNYLKS